MLNELKSFNILCDEYEGIVEQWKGPEREKLIELARIYRCYQTSLIDHELIDLNDMSVMVKDFVTDLDNEIAFLKGIRRLIVEDMYDFTPVQLDLIIALAHRVGHTNVIIPYDHNKGDIFSYVERTIRKFESLWELNIDINLDFKPQGDTSRGKLSEITKNYLKPNDPPAGNETVLIDDEVILIEAAGIYQEAEAIGKEIRKLLDAGVEPNKIGVLFSNLAVYSEMIEDVFNRFKIPIYFRRGKPLLSSNVIKTVFSFFELLGNNFERNAFLKIARSNYIDFWGGDESLSGEKIESYILRAGIIDDRGNSWENRLGRLIEKIEKTKSSAKKNTSANTHEEREEAKLLRDRV
ncbi:MAG: exodeoxyribonuclease V subunit gamma, partial [Deltaproteobacteria bacterium]|nr:exodeoxyribonuclease V subunit gamma [Deltaproteobacteria bacterium]